jgi:bacterioferritin-associated ferredoxin
MYVCNCRGITEREVLGAAELGCATIEELRRDLGVATCCGRCESDAKALVERTRRGERCGAPEPAIGG